MPSLRLSSLALAATLAGCASMKIQTEFDPAGQYGNYRTYAWLQTAPGTDQPPAVRNPTVRARVIGMIDNGLAAKGLKLAPAGTEPDLLLWVMGATQQRVEVSTYGYAYGGGMYAYGPYGSMGTMMPVTEARAYTEGTLILDFVDARSKQLVWRGVASDTLSSPTVPLSVIDEAVTKILAEYPPRPR